MRDHNRISRRSALAAFAALLLPAALSAPRLRAETEAASRSETAPKVELIMVEERGCPWCARWNKEVGVIYDKTPEGARAPLRRLDIHSAALKELDLASRPRFTPTFILIADGAEVGRLEGYAGEDFFWGLYGELLKKLPADARPRRPTPKAPPT